MERYEKMILAGLGTFALTLGAFVTHSVVEANREAAKARAEIVVMDKNIQDMHCHSAKVDLQRGYTYIVTDYSVEKRVLPVANLQEIVNIECAAK